MNVIIAILLSVAYASSTPLGGSRTLTTSEILLKPINEVRYDELELAFTDWLNAFLDDLIPAGCEELVLSHTMLGALRYIAVRRGDWFHMLLANAAFEDELLLDALDNWHSTGGQGNGHGQGNGQGGQNRMASSLARLLKNAPLPLGHARRSSRNAAHAYGDPAVAAHVHELVTGLVETLKDMYIEQLYNHFDQLEDDMDERLPMEDIFFYVDTLPSILASDGTGTTLSVANVIQGLEDKLTELLGGVQNLNCPDNGAPQRIAYMGTQATAFKQWLTNLSIADIIDDDAGTAGPPEDARRLLGTVMHLVKDTSYVDHVIHILYLPEPVQAFRNFAVCYAAEVLTRETEQAYRAEAQILQFLQSPVNALAIEHFLQHVRDISLDDAIAFFTQRLAGSAAHIHHLGVPLEQLPGAFDMLIADPVETTTTTAETLRSAKHSPDDLKELAAAINKLLVRLDNNNSVNNNQ